MPETVIQVEGLSKLYRIGSGQGNLYGYTALRDVLMDKIKSPFRLLRSSTSHEPRATSHEIIWALKNVSFEVKPGEVVGVIGRNGAGKSTLLKILSRITEPTEGRARITGRVGSLLEVGTGFHPELTGRENVYLNGAILGMRKSEIDARFDEMVAFAEVEKFIDTPVKFYSSGMYVRLAFAVAAHLRPEIMLVDEVLAVGDVVFQKKCMGKMEQVASEGRTVLIVSHSMSTVKALCPRAILLEQGERKADGPANDVVARYLSMHQVDAAEKTIRDEDHHRGVRKLRIRRIRLLNSANGSFSLFWKQPIAVGLDIEALEPLKDVAFGAGIRAVDGSHVFTVHQDDDGDRKLWNLDPGRYTIEFTLDNFLRPGLYGLHIGADVAHSWLQNIVGLDAITLEVLDHAENGGVPEVTNTGIVDGRSTWKLAHHG
ncbi:MAG: ABC transporter ATP-binding protein [Nitrospirae bacterium]|nr:ABC transporter ATP-binding protein [Nitrospirota bacterium]